MSPEYLESLDRLRVEEARRRCAAFFDREAAARPGFRVEYETNDLGHTFARAVSQRPGAPVRSRPVVGPPSNSGPAGAPFPPLVATVTEREFPRDSLRKFASETEVEMHRSRPGEAIPDRANNDLLRQRWAAWCQHVENRASGPAMPDDVAEKMAQARRENQLQTVRMARKMEDAGAVTFDRGRPSTWLVDPIGERAEELPAVRRINFFPSVAASRRNGQLSFCEHYLRPLAARSEMLTFTAGPRVATPFVRETISRQHRELGELARQRWFKAAAELVWRGTELGGLRLSERSAEDLNRRRSIPETVSLPGLPGLGSVSVANPDRFKAGDRNPEAWAGSEPLWHIHSHAIIVWHPETTEPAKREFWNRCRSEWGWVCDRSGRLEKIKEAVKYPVKPADVEVLTGPQTVALAEATARLKIVLPRGGLRRFRSDVREAIHSVRREFDSEGRSTTVIRPDWNSKLSKRADRKPNRRPVRKTGDGTGPTDAEKRADPLPFRLSQMPVPDRSTDAVSTDEKPKPPKNHILAQCSPAPIFGRDPRPFFVVWNFDGNFDAFRSRARVARTCAAFTRARATRAPRAADFRVHTTHPTCTPAAPPGAAGPPGDAPEPRK